jgi:hypothetical protein
MSEQDRVITIGEGGSPTSALDADTDGNERSDLESNQLKQTDCESEFGDTELEELVESEGPHEILQLIIQEQADEFMKEEITDSDDYADWLQWVSDVVQGEQVISATPKHEEAHVLLQLQQMDGDFAPNKFEERLPVSNNCATDSRWEEISQKILVDQNLDEAKGQELWGVLEHYQDVFAWNKRELGCCTIGEHSIDTQRYPPCRVSPGRLSY